MTQPFWSSWAQAVSIVICGNFAVGRDHQSQARSSWTWMSVFIAGECTHSATRRSVYQNVLVTRTGCGAVTGSPAVPASRRRSGPACRRHSAPGRASAVPGRAGAWPGAGGSAPAGPASGRTNAAASAQTTATPRLRASPDRRPLVLTATTPSSPTSGARQHSASVSFLHGGRCVLVCHAVTGGICVTEDVWNRRCGLAEETSRLRVPDHFPANNPRRGCRRRRMSSTAGPAGRRPL